MIFGKHINRYYIKYAAWLLTGLVALIVVDYFQLIIPNLYQMLINGINDGVVMVDGIEVAFNFASVAGYFPSFATAVTTI